MARSRDELIWTWPVRITHWSVAAIVLFNLFNDSGGKIHRYAGYAAATLVVARGFYAWFHRGRPAGIHWPTPTACLNQLRAMMAGNPPLTAGHNPLGMSMALLLWSLVFLLVLTGWISRWDRFWGEDWPITLHTWLSIALQCAVLLHLLGVAVSSLLERRNLIVSMINGRKRVD